MRASPGILSYPTGNPYLALLRSQGFTSYWPLQTQRNDGASEPDVIGSKNMAMAGGNTANVTDGPIVSAANAQSFVNGDTEGMSYSTSNYDPDQNWTLSMWVRCGNLPAVACFWQWALLDGTNYLYLLHRDDRSGMTIQIGDGGSARFLDWGDNIDNDNTWHHLCVTRAYSGTATADTWTCYLDGASTASSTRSAIGHGDLSAGIQGWFIANRTGVDLGITGDVCHVAFAEGVTLSGAQVLAHQDYT